MMTATQYGDPAKGPYQVLIKFPAGATASPHYHKVDEFATVASGTLLLGTGETVDASKAVEVSAGGYIHIPAGVAHWARCASDAVIVRFAPGPRELTPCSPEKPAPNKAAAPKGTPAKDVKWTEVPDLGKGAMRHEPYGDGKKGPHVFTLRFPAGVVRPPHWHGSDECVTVLSGKVLFGQGEKLDEAKAVEVPAGGYVIVPAKVPHWLITREEAVFTVTVNGPRDIFYVNPADDPARKK
jgi:quercetin dioxygenase-like cupin family protein